MWLTQERLVLNQNQKHKNMAKFILQVSAHGQYDNKSQFPIAKNWVYHFFSDKQQCVPYPLSEEIFQWFVKGELDKVNQKVIETRQSPKKVDNYVLWDLQDPNYTSGVFQAGSKVPIVDITGVTYNDPISLSNLLTLAIEVLEIRIPRDEVIIYFNACRA